MPKSPSKDFAISWKMGPQLFFPFLSYHSLPKPQKLIFFDEIWYASQVYSQEFSHNFLADLGTHKRGDGPKTAIWPLLAFFSGFSEVMSHISQSNHRTIYCFGEIWLPKIVNIEKKYCYDWSKNEFRSYNFVWPTFTIFRVFWTLTLEGLFAHYWNYFFRIVRQKLHIGTTYPRTFGHFYYFWHSRLCTCGRSV